MTPRLGFDLRPYFDETVAAPIPGGMQELGSRLMDAVPCDEPADPDGGDAVTPPSAPPR